MIALLEREVANTSHVKAERFYRPELDVVRFIAFSAVFLHHELPRGTAQDRAGILLGHTSAAFTTLFTGAVNACGFGMALFFTLSAYLIGVLLLREKQSYGQVNLRAFYVRRMLRIWPLYFFALAIGAAIAVFVTRRPHDLLILASFAFMAGNWSSIFWYLANPMNILWSISVEEQFYLFCPLTVQHLSRRGLYRFSFGLIVLSDLTLYLLGHAHADPDRTIWYNSLVQFQMFGAGLLLCLATKDRKFSFPLWGRLLSLVSGLGCWLIACLAFGAKQIAPARSGSSMVAGYTLACAGCLLIMIAMLDINRRWLPAWMIWLGRVSFGLYVYHELALWTVTHLFVSIHGYEHRFVCFISSAVLTVLLAGLSYRFLEMPFLRMKEHFEFVPSRLA
jgi:peptidoglycan/LPS O-acetylase OafA/YrhL